MSDCCSVNGKTPEVPAVLTCPGCGTRSKQVDSLTVKSLVRHLPFALPSTQYYFCAARGCEVVYFPADSRADRFHQRNLLVRVGVKEDDPAVPVCYCFGITPREIQAEIEQTGKSTAAQRIKAEVQAGRCACEVKNPSGKCCLGNVTRAVQDALHRAEQTPVTHKFKLSAGSGVNPLKQSGGGA